jgi:hypothetical protein
LAAIDLREDTLLIYFKGDFIMLNSEDTQEKKAFDKMGREISDGQVKQELISIEVTKEELNEIFVQRHERFSKVDISRQGQFLVALAYVHAAKALLSVTSKEKAKEALAKAVYDFAYMEGRKAAEKRGNPKDLRSYLEYQHEGLSRAAFIPPPLIVEWTETKQVSGMIICPFADMFRQIAEMFKDYADQDVMEVAGSRCTTLDRGRAEGFNPDLKFTPQTHLLNDFIGEGPRDDYCSFKVEVPE